MSDQCRWYAGVDLGSQSHCGVLTDEAGRKIGKKFFKHGGEGLAATIAWLMAASGADAPDQLLAAIEVLHGPLVKTLIESASRFTRSTPSR